jgi:hypothetical protein
MAKSRDAGALGAVERRSLKHEGPSPDVSEHHFLRKLLMLRVALCGKSNLQPSD